MAEEVSGESFIFDYFLIIELKQTKTGRVANERYQFPKEIADPDEKKFISSAASFCFPDRDEIEPVSKEVTRETDRFSFVLTADSGGRRFGYCMRPHISGQFPVACVILSVSPCFAFFSKVLDEVIARMNNTSDPTVIDGFLEAIHPNKLPAPGQLFCVKVPSPWRKNTLNLWRFTRPDDRDTPLEYIDFQPLLRTLSVKSVLRIYLSLLLERRIIFVSRSLQTLTACVQACVALLYPFEWQHVYIPLLPKQMMTFVCAPMPFIVGLLEPFLNDLAEYLEMLEAVVIVNLDKDAFQVSHKSPSCKYTIRSSFDDRSLVQSAVLEPLIAPIKAAKKQNKKQLSSTATKEKFLEGFLAFSSELLTHHDEYFDPSHEDGFQKVPFSEQSNEATRPFLTKFVSTQMFEQYIMVAVARHFASLNSGERQDLVDQYLKHSTTATRFTKFQQQYELKKEEEEEIAAEKTRKNKSGLSSLVIGREKSSDSNTSSKAFPGVRQPQLPFPGVRMQSSEASLPRPAATSGSSSGTAEKQPRQFPTTPAPPPPTTTSFSSSSTSSSSTTTGSPVPSSPNHVSPRGGINSLSLSSAATLPNTPTSVGSTGSLVVPGNSGSPSSVGSTPSSVGSAPQPSFLLKSQSAIANRTPGQSVGGGWSFSRLGVARAHSPTHVRTRSRQNVLAPKRMQPRWLVLARKRMPSPQLLRGASDIVKKETGLRRTRSAIVVGTGPIMAFRPAPKPPTEESFFKKK